MAKHEPVRTCVACRQESLKPELVRLTRSADGLVRLDRSGRAPGRGAYLHRTAACVNAAEKRRMVDRALGATAPPELWAELRSV